MTQFFVNVTAEPKALHDHPAFTVHLVPDTRHADKGVKAKALLEDFFGRAAPDFYAVELDANLDLGTPVKLTREELATLDAGEQVFNWLRQRAPDDTHEFFWTGHRDGVSAETDADKNHVTVIEDDESTVIPALDLLRGSLNWAAPLPQRAGLVHLALAQNPVADTDWALIFPWWGNDAPDEAHMSVTQLDGTSITAAFDKDDALRLIVNEHQVGETRFITTFVQPFNPIDADKQQNGWVAAGWAGTEDARRLRRIRTEMTGTLDPFAPLMSFVPADGEETAFATWINDAGVMLLFDKIDLAATGDGRFADSLFDILTVALDRLPKTNGGDAPAALKPQSEWVKPHPEIKKVLAAAKVIPEDAETILYARETLQNSLARLNELAMELNDPDKLRALVLEYLSAATDVWTTPLEIPAGVDKTKADDIRYRFATAAAAEFADRYAGAGANLSAELRDDAADHLLSLFRDELKKALAVPDAETPLQTALSDFGWMKKRVSDPPGGLRPLEELVPGLKGPVQEHLEAAYKDAGEGILSVDFVPDREPQPLSIIATDGLDPEFFDDISKQTTGFGLVIGASHPDSMRKLEDSYAHANVAALTIAGSAPEAAPGIPSIEVPMAIEPTTLCANFGQLEIEIAYNGVPQIGRLVAQKPGVGWPSLPMPFELTHVDFAEPEPAGQPVRRLPPLAYGFDYYALPFYIPNSGTLPDGLRADGSKILPAIQTTSVKDPAPDTYRRRTPVANVSLTRTPKSTHPGIGYIPDDVAPIAPELLKSSDLAKRADDPGLLLLGHNDPKKPFVWKPELSQGAKLTISTPRVSFDDFDRWVANPYLLGDLESTGLTEDTVERIEEARDFLEHIGAEAASELANRLPDPAVRHLSVRLDVFDSVWENRNKKTLEVRVELAPYEDLPQLPDDGRPIKYSHYVALLEEIDRNAQYQLQIDVKPGKRHLEPTTDNQLKAVVQPGDICLLTVSPMIPEAHYSQDGKLRAIDPGFLKIPDFFEKKGDMISPRGTSLLLEAMDMPAIPELGDHPKAPIFDALKVLPEGRDRGFALRLLPEFGPKLNDQAIFRAFSHVDLITHRWRTTGQPIPDWITPAELAGPDSPVVEVPYDEAPMQEVTEAPGPVAKFEAGAYYDRALYDGERRRIRLPPFVPNGGESNAVLLDRVNWPSPAATYLRYTQVYRSRYLGALASGDGTFPAIAAAAATADPVKQSRPVSDQFTTRVAILADVSGNTIVTPQLRHILPSLGGRQVGDAPLPYVCSLNERPFDQYGLADRVLPEVTTIQTYSVNLPEDVDGDAEGETQEEPARLAFDTYRKEIGPEPRANLKPVADDPSRQVTVRTEGPVGHHFDPPNADAPGFVNTSLLMHLDGLDPAWAGEQMFSAISLRRMVDPGWAWTPPAPETEDDALPTSWTFCLNNLPGEVAILHGAEDTPRVWVESGENVLTIWVDKQAAYGDGGPETGAATQSTGDGAGLELADDVPPQTDDLAELCRVNPDDARLRMVHRSLGKLGYEVMILRDVENTPFAWPQIVASARYKADGSPRPVLLTYAGDGAPAPLEVTPILVGDATRAQWALSAYDLGQVCFGTRAAHLSEAAAVVEDGMLGFQTHTGEARRLTSRDALIPDALGVHTYFGALTLRRSTNAGRKVYLPQNMVMLDPHGRANLAQGKDTDRAAILAFEAPAEVLRLQSLETASTVFDLDAVQSKAHSALLFRCRISTLVPSEGGIMTLEFASTAKLKLHDIDFHALQYVDVLVSPDGRLGEARLYWHDEAGTTSVLEGAALEHHLAYDNGEVSLTDGEIKLSVSGPKKLDMDVSMIPHFPTDGSGWDWDWVFPPVAGTGADAAGPAQMEDALRPAALTGQHEAVLAPKGMSPPFSLIHVPS